MVNFSPGENFCIIYNINGQQYYNLMHEHFVLLTDSVGHTVKENPSIFRSSEADIVAGLDTYHREEVNLIDSTSIGNYILDIVLMTTSKLMYKFCTLLAEIDDRFSGREM